MQHRSLKTTAIILALAATLLGTLYWWVLLRREHTRWTESIEFADGSRAKVEIEHSARVYWSFGHAGGFGGGYDRYCAEIQAAGKRYAWAGGNERPFAFGLRDGQMFMAAFDRSDMSRVRFRYHRSDSADRLHEILPAEFPKELAIQNVWLQPKDSDLLRNMDPDDYWFRDSLTARMWLHIVTGVDYFESFTEGKHPSPQFIREYKIKYLEATPNSPTTRARI